VQLLPEGIEQDVEVLSDQRILLGLQPALQLLLGFREALADPQRIARTEVGNLVVDAGDADLRGALGSKPGLRLEDDAGVSVAAGHPVGSGLRRRECKGRGERGGRAQGGADHVVPRGPGHGGDIIAAPAVLPSRGRAATASPTQLSPTVTSGLSRCLSF